MHKYFAAMDRERATWKTLADRAHQDYQVIFDACLKRVREVEGDTAFNGIGEVNLKEELEKSKDAEQVIAKLGLLPTDKRRRLSRRRPSQKTTIYNLADQMNEDLEDASPVSGLMRTVTVQPHRPEPVQPTTRCTHAHLPSKEELAKRAKENEMQSKAL